MNKFWVSPNSLLIECVITPGAGGSQNKNPFGTQKQLQNKKVCAIETYSSVDVLDSPISTGTPTISLALFVTSFLTLYRASVPEITMNGVTFPAQNEGLYYDQIPLPRLRVLNNYQAAGSILQSSCNDMFRVLPTEMSWTKSYVTCTPSVPMAGPNSALFLVHYLNEHQDWRPYM